MQSSNTVFCFSRGRFQQNRWVSLRKWCYVIKFVLPAHNQLIIWHIAIKRGNTRRKPGHLLFSWGEFLLSDIVALKGRKISLTWRQRLPRSVRLSFLHIDSIISFGGTSHNLTGTVRRGLGYVDLHNKHEPPWEYYQTSKSHRTINPTGFPPLK